MMGGPKGMWSDSPSFDPVKVEGTPDKLSHGFFTLHVSKKFPKHTYYQTAEVPCMGGLIVVHDGKGEKPHKSGKTNGHSLYDFSAV
jgi:hypothetical protein